ncbi:hypothetical protein BT63DRAFT_256252 [Microthyrium microscopicum]|uniref:Zn(2)-C6 fungal-type domain-containing protein n=1 Tax=Microthyrium microscopicum TaxID=703497 RepID=A0A6A6UEG7_9PEZI|nr:hypothetical protein BT63DRAFT_256252 [Microthyrium microscopicum]
MLQRSQALLGPILETLASFKHFTLTSLLSWNPSRSHFWNMSRSPRSDSSPNSIATRRTSANPRIRKHKKSRNGCVHCKARRVKCDELYPCTNCVNRNEKCERRNEYRVVECLTCNGIDRPALSSQWSRDVFLMSHFTTNTVKEFSAMGSGMIILWKEGLPGLAMEHPYLMNGILSLSAFHMAYQRPTERVWVQHALKYQNTALNQLRLTLSNITSKNFHAVFGLVIILSLSSMSHSRSTSHGDEIAPIADILEPVMHNRGVFKLLCFGHRWYLDGPLVALRGAGMVTGMPTKLNEATRNQFNRLRNWMGKSCADVDIRQCLFTTLDRLETTFAEVHTLRDSCSPTTLMNIIWKWAAFTSEEYLSLLRGSNPLALIIFAHFAMLSGIVEDTYWYLVGYSRRALKSVRAALPDHWTEFLRWPERQLEDGFSDLFEVSEEPTYLTRIIEDVTSPTRSDKTDEAINGLKHFELTTFLK